jgi:hypothetical protein
MNAKGPLSAKPKPLSLFAPDAATLNHVQSTLACASGYRVRQSRGYHPCWNEPSVLALNRLQRRFAATLPASRTHWIDCLIHRSFARGLGGEGVSRLSRGTDSDRSAPTRNQCAFGNTLRQESPALSWLILAPLHLRANGGRLISQPGTAVTGVVTLSHSV